ncbi:hypothetical protein [Candidatus Nanopusillus massiliensis]|uniref:hypothetical protein n=1 Tax=Candidatus Nanopusillus massiliensis TaxID=2897163 RepID=UPI001E2B6CC6|nr:hypothetical protein [Candidatus Nanopusillus massiliensis]
MKQYSVILEKARPILERNSNILPLLEKLIEKAYSPHSAKFDIKIVDSVEDYIDKCIDPTNIQKFKKGLEYLLNDGVYNILHNMYLYMLNYKSPDMLSDDTELAHNPLLATAFNISPSLEEELKNILYRYLRSPIPPISDHSFSYWEIERKHKQEMAAYDAIFHSSNIY